VPFPALRLTRYRMTKIQIFREIQDGSAALGFYTDVTVSEPPGSRCNWRAKSRTGVVFGLYLDVSHREPLGGHCNRRDISRRWDCVVDDGSAVLGFYSDVTMSEPPGGRCN
jgi:hypothetical protein